MTTPRISQLDLRPVAKPEHWNWPVFPPAVARFIETGSREPQMAEVFASGDGTTTYTKEYTHYARLSVTNDSYIFGPYTTSRPSRFLQFIKAAFSRRKGW